MLAELGALAERVLALLPHKTDSATLVALRGELGAGKTTFVQALGKRLGIGDTMQSPTYVLMRSYPTAHTRLTKLVHIDAYRLDKPEEFVALQPDKFLRDPHTLVLLEWPERVEGMLPPADITIRFSSQDAGEEERYIEVV